MFVGRAKNRYRAKIMKKASNLLSSIPLRILLVLAFVLPIILAVGIVTIFFESGFLARIYTNNQTMLWFIGLTLLIATGLGIATTQWIVQPILRLTQYARAIAEGNFEQRIPLNRTDEIGTLAQSFNNIATHMHAVFFQLKSNEQRYRGLFENSKDTMLITSPKGQVQDINVAGLLLFGYTKEEVLRLNIKQLHIDPQDRTDLLHILRSRGFVENFEVSFRRKNGDEIFCQETAVADYSSDGQLIAVQSVLRDMSRQKKILQAVRDSEIRVRAIFYAMTDGLITFDADGQINDINPAAEKLFDYTAGEIIDQKIETIIPALSVGRYEHFLSDYLEPDEETITNIGHKTEGKRKDSSTFPVELALSMFYHKDQKMFVGIVRHIAEKK